MTDVSGRLAGKTVIVTGAGRGQGLEEARLFALAGARVIGCDVEIGQLATESAIEHVAMDVTKPQDWAALATHVDDHYGGEIHGLVNNAGITLRSRLLDVSVDDWNHVFAVNCTGALLGMQTVVPRMRSGASVVNIGSAAAFSGHYTVAYTSSKWAMRGLSAVASLELGPAGIRVNSVHPGFVETEMTGSAPPEFREATWRIMPMPRTGQVADVAHLVLFLLSDESQWISGAEIHIDGGQVMAGGSKVLSDALRSATPGTSA